MDSPLYSGVKNQGTKNRTMKKKWDTWKMADNLLCCSLRCMEEEMYYKVELGSDNDSLEGFLSLYHGHGHLDLSNSF